MPRIFIDINDARLREYCRLTGNNQKDNFIMSILRNNFDVSCRDMTHQVRASALPQQVTQERSRRNYSTENATRLRSLLKEYSGTESVKIEEYIRNYTRLDYETIISLLETGMPLHELIDGVNSKAEMLRLLSSKTGSKKKKKKKSRRKRSKRRKTR
jgi:hypothetical protein